MDDLDGARDVRVHSIHGGHLLHRVLVAHELIGYGNAEFQHFQLRVTSFLDVSVHVHFVIECLVMLDDESLERGVLIALKLREEVLSRGVWEHLVLQSESLLRFESDSCVFHREVIFVDSPTDIFIVLEHVLGSNVQADCRLSSILVIDLRRFLIRQELVVIEITLAELSSHARVQFPSKAPHWLLAYLPGLDELLCLWLGINDLHIDSTQWFLE